MTPLPKKKHTKARRGKRLEKNKMALSNLVVCPECKKMKYPHVKCPHCGYYHKTAKVQA